MIKFWPLFFISLTYIIFSISAHAKMETIDSMFAREFQNEMIKTSRNAEASSETSKELEVTEVSDESDQSKESEEDDDAEESDKSEESDEGDAEESDHSEEPEEDDSEESDQSEEPEEDDAEESDQPEESEENDAQESNQSEELEEDDAQESNQSEVSDEDDSEEKNPKLIETSGTIDFSYGGVLTDDANEFATDLSGSLDIIVTPNDNLSFHSTIGKRRDTDLEIDEAYIDWSVRDDQTIFLKVGKKFAPFTESNSEMINTALPLQLGETDPDAILEGSAEFENMNYHVYLFKGTSPQTDGTGKHEFAYGLGAEYQKDKMDIGVNYLSNLAESDAFNTNNVERKVPAIEVHGQIELGRFTVTGVYLTAAKDFLPDDLDGEITTAAKPSASQLEVDIALKNNSTLALAWNATQGAQEIDLAKEVLSIAYSQQISKKLTAAIELSRSKDYDNNKSKEVILEFSYEFLSADGWNGASEMQGDRI